MKRHLHPLVGAGALGLPLMLGLTFAQQIALPSIAKWWDEQTHGPSPPPQNQ